MLKKVFRVLASGVLAASMLSAVSATTASAVQDNSGHTFPNGHCRSTGLIKMTNIPDNTYGSYYYRGGTWLWYNGYTISQVSYFYKSGSWGNGSAYARSGDNQGTGLDIFFINGNHVYHDSVINCNGTSRYSPSYLTPAYADTPVLTAKYKANGLYIRGAAYWR